jgi:hypothetical protein
VNPAPPEIDGAKVLLFTAIDGRHLPTGGCRHEVGGVQQPPVSGLAIGRYSGEEGFYLFYCDSEWNCLTDTYHPTIEKAKAQSEFEYKGVSETWQMSL